MSGLLLVQQPLRFKDLYTRVVCMSAEACGRRVCGLVLNSYSNSKNERETG